MDQNAKCRYRDQLIACLSDYREQTSPFEQDSHRTETFIYGDNDAAVLDLKKYESLRRQLLEKEHWGKKFTEEYIDEELRRLFRRLKEEECQRIFDLFRYTIHTMGQDHYRIAVGRQGEVNRFVRRTPVISSDGQRFGISSQTIGPLALFRIAPDTITRMDQIGVFKVAELLKQEIHERSFGEILLRSIRWFSNAQIQIVKENQYLNLTSCLETFLTPGDPNEKISNTIAEGVAFVLGNGPEERRQLKKKVKDLYNKRSKVSHGGHSAIQTFDLDALRTITGDFLSQMIQRMDEFHTRDDLNEWIENQKFG